MVHIGAAVLIDPIEGVTSFGDRVVPPSNPVLIVRDHGKNSEFLDAICDFLDIPVEHASTSDELSPLLRGLRPMAVIADVESDAQDGFHVMKVAAGYDRKLPVMLLTSNDPALLGAIDAVREAWDLARVATMSGDVSIGVLVDFMCHAARDAGMPRLMRV